MTNPSPPPPANSTDEVDVDDLPSMQPGNNAETGYQKWKDQTVTRRKTAVAKEDANTGDTTAKAETAQQRPAMAHTNKNNRRSSNLLERAVGFVVRDTEDALSEDCYSLMYLSPVASPAFLWSLAVFAIQMTLLLLVFLDLVDFDNTTQGVANVLNIPSGVELRVTIAQGIGVVLIVLTISADGDLTTALGMFADGYSRKTMGGIPGATRGKWFCSALTQLLVGVLMIADLYVLLMQSTNVVLLCLNFAALEFVGQVDDWCFKIGDMGLITDSFQRDCQLVKETQVPASRRQRTRWARRLLLPLLTIALFTGYAVMVSRQWNGEYLCRSLYVQFSDETVFDSGLSPAHYSGYFLSQGSAPKERFNSRTQYLDASGTLRLVYCADLQAWVFVKPGITDKEAYCTGFFAKSSTTNTLDVTTVGGDPWLTTSSAPSGGEVVTNWLLVICRDCKVDEDLCPSERGTCQDNRVCQCEPGYIGLSCEFVSGDSCQLLQASDPEELESLKLLDFEEFQTDSWNLALREVNQRPILVSNPIGASTPPPVMLFTGRRWTIYGAMEDAFWPRMDINRNRFDQYFTPETIRDPLETMKLMEEWKLRPMFVSEEMNYGSPLHLLVPQRLQFYHTKRLGKGWVVDFQRPISTTYSCAHCSSDDPCLNGGICSRNLAPFESFGKCQCVDRYQGERCEIAPTCSGDGDCYGDWTDDWRCDLDTGTCMCGDLQEHHGGSLCQLLNETTRICGNKICYNSAKCFEDWTLGNLIEVGNACICDYGYFGPQCEWPKTEDHIEYCGPNTCKNSQTCVYTDNHANDFCFCTAPFYGDSCQYIKDDANPSKCFDQECLNGGSCKFEDLEGKICDCDDPFYGNYCEFVKNETDPSSCFNSTCQNGGVCNYGWSGCYCPDGFDGSHCQYSLEDNQCLGIKCANDFNCSTTGMSYGDVTEKNPWCECGDYDDFYGRTCQFEVDLFNTSKCADGACSNGGRCAYDFVDDKPVCHCPDPFYGPSCELEKNTDNSSICTDDFACLNGGDCHFQQLFSFDWSDPPRYVKANNPFWDDDNLPQWDPTLKEDERHQPWCKCEWEYYGEKCEYKKDYINKHKCFNFTCENQGRCNYADWKNQHCFCQELFHGSRCQETKAANRGLREQRRR